MQPQYRAYAQQQAPQRSPHAPNQRRGGIGKSLHPIDLSDPLSLPSPAGFQVEMDFPQPATHRPMMSSGPHPSLPLTPAQIAQQQQAQAHASEMAKRRSRRPTDKNIPDGVEHCIIDPEAAIRYGELRDVERLLDSTTTRKRLDLIDSAKSQPKLRRTLRVWVSNTVEDQIWQGNGISVDSFDFAPAMEASYRVKIEGRLLDDPVDLDDLSTRRLGYEGAGAVDKMQEDAPPLPKPKTALSSPPHRFSEFFHAISVDFDQSRFRNGAEQSVEWKRPEPTGRGQSAASQAAAASFDEFCFKRNGDENINITINLYRHESPEKYKLSPELADVVDMSEATQHEAVMALWEYIRLSGLQEDEEKRNFRCDDLLRRITGRETGAIPMLNEYLMPHLRPLGPISLPYTIRVDEAFHKNPQPTVYDVQVCIDDPSRATLKPLLNNPSYAAMLKEVNGLDDQLARLVQAISVSKAKHSFFTSMSEDPAGFVRSWLSSQKRDLEVIMGEVASGYDNVAGDEWRRGGNPAWASQNARESVHVLLSRQR